MAENAPGFGPAYPLEEDPMTAWTDRVIGDSDLMYENTNAGCVDGRTPDAYDNFRDYTGQGLGDEGFDIDARIAAEKQLDT